MGRSSNDDRSDSMNPNNDAYWASEANRDNQLGRDDDDEPATQYRAPSRPQPRYQYNTYAVAILTFEGTSMFYRFSTRDADVYVASIDPPMSVVQGVWHLTLDWMNEISPLGIAYARIWGPGMMYLPKLIWNAPGESEAYWSAPERLTERRFGDSNEVAKARAWYGIVDKAKRFEHALEMLDFKGAEDLGLLTKIPAHNMPNPLLDLKP